MQKLNTDIRSRIRNQKGVSLAELLLAILIMSLLTLAIAAGVGTAVKVYNSSRLYSESRVLSNSVMEEIRNSLRYAYDIDVASGTNSLTFNSKEYGKNAVIALDGETGKADKTENAGRFIITYGNTSEDKTFYPLQTGAYSGFYIQAPENGHIFTLESSDLLSVSFAVCDTKTGAVQAKIENVKIKLLNNATISAE